MQITVKRPTRDIEVITDYEILQGLIDTYNQIQPLRGQDDGEQDFTTEGQASRDRMRREALERQLEELNAQLDSKTLVITIQGLNASQWNQIAVKHTRIGKDHTVIKDLQAMLAEALPEMTAATRWKNGDTVDMSKAEITTFVASMTDTQIAEIIGAMQELNSPIASVPKAISATLSNITRA